MGLGICQSLANGEKPNVYEETHPSCQLPFLSFSPIIYFCQNVVELVIAWMGRVWATKIRIGQRTISEKRVLTSLARKIPKNVGHFAMHSRFSVSSRFGSSWSFSCVFHCTIVYVHVFASMHSASALCFSILLQICLSILFLAVLSILFKPVHVHGLLARSDQASSRVLFAGRRHGDVTIWYQSAELQQWASMGQGRTTDRGYISFCPAEV